MRHFMVLVTARNSEQQLCDALNELWEQGYGMRSHQGNMIIMERREEAGDAGE